MNATKPMNPVKDIKYCSLDLELNNKSDGTVPKIIQVGCALASPLRPNDIKTYSWYVNPQEPLVQFITELTGITEEVIATQSVPLSQVAEELGNILTQEKPFVNPITWGGNDAAELLQEFRDGGIDFPFFGRRILDVKTLFVYLEQVNGRSPSGGLRSAMGKYKCPFIGTPHRADVDAYNTLRFYFALVNRQRKLEDAMNLLKTVSY
jgi:inhibitor of KinA sporulation pathway (predicted exonuclease)